MKLLLHIQSTTIGGYEIQLAQLMRRLISEGVQVYLDTSPGPVHELFAEYGVPHIFSSLAQDNFNLDRIEPDLVVTVQGNIFGLARACKSRRIPIFWVCGYPPAESEIPQELSTLAPIMFDHVFVPSDFLLSQVRKIPGLPCSTLPCIVTPTSSSKMFTRRELGISADSYLMGYAARYAPHKRHGDLILALSQLRRAGVDAELLLLGWSTPKDQHIFNGILKQAEELKLGGAIRAVTALPNQLPDFLSLLDVFVSPSENEGMGCALLEALSLGIPTISTVSSGSYAFVEANNCGSTYNTGDIHSLSQQLMRFFLSPFLRHEFGTRGMFAVKETFRSEYASAHFLRTFRGLSSRGAACPDAAAHVSC